MLFCVKHVEQLFLDGDKAGQTKFTVYRHKIFYFACGRAVIIQIHISPTATFSMIARDKTVADLEIQKGGFSTGALSASANFWVATPTFGHAGSPN